MLKKKISLDVRWADLQNDTHRLLFTVGIAHLDIDGRISGDPREFKAAVVPMLDYITQEVLLAFFQDAERLGLIWRYRVEGRWVIQYPGFKKNQNLRPDKEAMSQYPPPPPDFSPGVDTAQSGVVSDDSGSSPGVVTEHSGTDPAGTSLVVNRVNEEKHLERAGRQDADVDVGITQDSGIEDSDLQQNDIIGENHFVDIGQSPCSRTTPGVVRDDSGRTPAEVKRREVKRSEVNVQASACVIGGADDPPTAFSSQIKPSGLVELWNDLGCRPLVSELTDERRRKAGLRIRKRGDPDWWGRLFEKVRALNKPWLTFDFLMRNDTNCLKVLEGNYDHDFSNRGNGRGTKSGPQRTPRGYDQRKDQYVIDVPDPD